MLVCVLSADYLADSSAVFVLESGIQVGQHESSQGELTMVSITRATFYVFFNLFNYGSGGRSYKAEIIYLIFVIICVFYINMLPKEACLGYQ